MLYPLARPVLFRLDAERAHEAVTRRLETGRSPRALAGSALESRGWGPYGDLVRGDAAASGA